MKIASVPIPFPDSRNKKQVNSKTNFNGHVITFSSKIISINFSQGLDLKTVLLNINH